MKKLSLVLVLVFIALTVSACTGTPVIYQTNCNCPGTCNTDAAPAQNENTPAPAEGELKTGLAIVANAKDSKSASADANGEAKYDVTVVAITVDANGRIASCIIDSIGASYNFDAAGQLVTDMSAQVLTKNELKEGYNMKAWGQAKYEWYEQAASLAKYVTGKTVEEVKAISVNEATKPTEADLASTVTISIGGYVNAIEKAVANAQNLGAKAGDELRLAISPAFASCAAATAEKAGNAELDVDVCALTVNGGVITSCFIDSVQCKVAFDAQGQINKAIEGSFLTKNELKEGYNMKTWGQAKYEWYEQAASFCKYVTGKTFAEVKNIAVDAGTKPTEADLSASVTIAIGGFQGLIEKVSD